MASEKSSKIESILQEQRIFPPSTSESSKSKITSMDSYQQMVDRSKNDPNQFWSEVAKKELHWFEPFESVLDWSNPPFAKWFQGGKTNISFN